LYAAPGQANPRQGTWIFAPDARPSALEAGAVYVTSEPKITLSDLAGCLKTKVKYVGLQAEEDAGPDWAAERERRRLEEYRTGGAEEARKK
jgi:hypothetical protein